MPLHPHHPIIPSSHHRAEADELIWCQPHCWAKYGGLCSTCSFFFSHRGGIKQVLGRLLRETTHPVDCLRVKRRLGICLPAPRRFSPPPNPFTLNPAILLSTPSRCLRRGRTSAHAHPALPPSPTSNSRQRAGSRRQTLSHLFLYPGTVTGRRHDQLDEAAAQEHQQQDGGDELPHVVVEAVRREAQHVLQVFKEPGGRAGSDVWVTSLTIALHRHLIELHRPLRRCFCSSFCIISWKKFTKMEAKDLSRPVPTDNTQTLEYLLK